MNAKCFAYKWCFFVVELINLHFFSLDLFLRNFEWETFNFIARSQILIGEEFQINLALALGSIQIPNHLSAELSTKPNPPSSQWAKLSVNSTRWSYTEKKPKFSSELTTDSHYSTSDSTSLIFGEGVRLKFFCDLAVPIATQRSQTSRNSLYLWSRSVTKFSFLLNYQF